jgi:hypothetical protein
VLKVATGPVALGGFTLARDMGAEDVELLVHRGAIFWRKSFLHALDFDISFINWDQYIGPSLVHRKHVLA